MKRTKSAGESVMELQELLDKQALTSEQIAEKIGRGLIATRSALCIGKEGRAHQGPVRRLHWPVFTPTAWYHHHPLGSPDLVLEAPRAGVGSQAMTDDEALHYFEKNGKAAGFLLGCGPAAAAENGEKRQNTTIAIYLNHPHLQNKMYDIAKGFTWSLVARMEQVRVLQELDSQRGARAC